MTAKVDLAISEDKALLVVVENDGYSVEEYPSTDFGVKNFDGCFSFTLENDLYLCVRKNIYRFCQDEHKWKELIDSMDTIRYGTSCVSLQQGTLITGGQEHDGCQNPKLTDNCLLLLKKDDGFTMNSIGKLPAKLKYHSLTKVSSQAFILSGGVDIDGYETRDVYLGSLRTVTNDSDGDDTSSLQYRLNWTKLPKMCEYRSSHFTMYAQGKLYVFGGGLKRDEKQHVVEVNAMHCGLELGYSAGMIIEILPFTCEDQHQYRVGKWSRRYMRYDISFANLVLSPDEKYAIIAGGEIYGFGCRKEDTFYMTMNTTTLNMRSLGDKDKTLHTNNVLKMIATCNCLTPMYDDIENEA